MARDNRTEVHRNINKTLRGGRKCDENSTDPSCTGFVEMMAPVYSRASWRCIWHLIQNDLVHAWVLGFQPGYCAQAISPSCKLHFSYCFSPVLLYNFHTSKAILYISELLILSTLFIRYSFKSKFWSQRSTSSSDSDIDTDRESETAVVTEISTEGSCYRIDVSDASDDKEDDPKRVLKSAKVKHFDEMMLRLTN
ncbi:hypothetical protein EV1_034978 [Malus domestica]